MAVMGRTRPTVKPGLTIPKSSLKVSEWPVSVLKWLYSYYVFDDVIKKHRISYIEESNSILYYVMEDNEVVFAQTRGFPNKYIRGIGAKQLYKVDNNHNTVVIVEDYVSAMRLAENNVDSICLFGTSMKDEDIKPILSRWDNIIMWLDGDEAGIKGRKTIEKKLKRQIKELKVKYPLRYPQNWSILSVSSEKDPKCYSDIEIKEMLCLINSEKP
jgi:5S rRNA maturation endonuclease (ribonuclease M5)